MSLILLSAEAFSIVLAGLVVGVLYTGLGNVYISQLEHGKKEPGLRTIEVLAISFDMTPAQLLRGIHK